MSESIIDRNNDNSSSSEKQIEKTLPFAFKKLYKILYGDELLKIFFNYYEKSSELNEVINLVRSENLKKIVEAIQKNGEIMKFIDWIQSTGVTLIDFIEQFYKKYGCCEKVDDSKFVSAATYNQYTKEIEDVHQEYVWENFITEVSDLVLINPEFYEFVGKLFEIERHLLEIFDSVECKNFMDELREKGVGIDGIGGIILRVTQFYSWLGDVYHGV